LKEWGIVASTKGTDGRGIRPGLGDEEGNLSFPNPLANESYFIDDEGNIIYFQGEIFSDTDGDGLDDGFEDINGLDMYSIDSDEDGLTDYDEIVKYPTDEVLSQA